MIRPIANSLLVALLLCAGSTNTAVVQGAEESTNSTTTTTTTLDENLMTCATSEQVATIDDFFPTKVDPQNADTWTVSYHGTFKLLTNLAVNETYVLYQCGTEPPTDDEIAVPYKFKTPIPLPDGVALTSTVQIPLFEALGLSNEIKTYIGDTQYISSPCLLDRLKDGSLEDYDPTEVNDVSETAAVILWQNQHPERVLVENQFMESSGQGTPKTLIENGYLEEEPKAIAEWLLFYSTLYNKEAMAQQIHDETFERYECTAANAAITFGAADSNKPKLKAVWAYWSNYPGYEGWVTAKCESKHRYYCDFAKLCNLDLLHQENGSMNDTAFETWAKDADIFFFDYTNWHTIVEEKPYLKEFKSYKNQHVYDHEASGNFTWWEQRMIEFDVALEDVCTIANQTTDLTPHELHWFRNVFEYGPYDVPKDLLEHRPTCVDPTAPLTSRATECTRLVGSPTFTSTSPSESEQSSAMTIIATTSTFVIAAVATTTIAFVVA